MMNDRFEMNDEMMEQVNGGYSWEEFWEEVKKSSDPKAAGAGFKQLIDLIPQIF